MVFVSAQLRFDHELRLGKATYANGFGRFGSSKKVYAKFGQHSCAVLIKLRNKNQNCKTNSHILNNYDDVLQSRHIQTTLFPPTALYPLCVKFGGYKDLRRTRTDAKCGIHATGKRDIYIWNGKSTTWHGIQQSEYHSITRSHTHIATVGNTKDLAISRR